MTKALVVVLIVCWYISACGGARPTLNDACLTRTPDNETVSFAYVGNISNVSVTIDNVSTSFATALCESRKLSCHGKDVGLGYLMTVVGGQCLVFNVAGDVSYVNGTATRSYSSSTNKYIVVVNIKCSVGDGDVLAGNPTRHSTVDPDGQKFTLEFVSGTVCPGYQPGGPSPPSTGITTGAIVGFVIGGVTVAILIGVVLHWRSQAAAIDAMYEKL